MSVYLRRAVCLLCLLPAGLAAWAQPSQPLQLEDRRGAIEAWPAVTLLPDPSGHWQLEDVQRRMAELRAPSGAWSNLGPRSDAVWLHVPLEVPAGDRGRWLLDVDYAQLDRIDVYQLTEGRLLQRVRMGDDQPFDLRPLPLRTHAVALELQPGLRHELWLRVQSTSSLVTPISLMTVVRYHQREARVQVFQGLLVGISLCLLIYNLVRWRILGDRTFAFYALSVAGMSVFFFAYFGLGPQHLWGSSVWLMNNVASLGVLISLASGLLFVDRALLVAQHSPRWSRAIRGAAGIGAVAAAALIAGWLNPRSGQLVCGALGLLAMGLGLPAAVVRLREGDRAALYVVIGWSLHGAGAIVMLALLRGHVGSNWWTQHAFQLGMVVEMLAWQGVLAVRQEQARREAEQADRDREIFRSLAYTDPLTGLPNRRGLQIELASALPRASAQQQLAVYLIDLDGFKAVNDGLGHDAGDELLKAVAERLRAPLRHRDVLARLGGDEFVVMVTDLPGEDGARRLGQKLLDAFAAPFNVRGQSWQMGLTVGYALAPADGVDADYLIKRADAAMYSGKQAGKNTLRRSPPAIGLVSCRR